VVIFISKILFNSSTGFPAGFPPVGSKTPALHHPILQQLNQQTNRKTSVAFNWGGIQRKLVEAWGKLYGSTLPAPCFISFTAQRKKKKDRGMKLNRNE